MSSAYFYVGLLALVLLISWLYTLKLAKPKLRTVAILVLGDIGRSPRMMYHAESFATAEFQTYLVGYMGSAPIASLLSLPRMRIIGIAIPPWPISALPFLLAAPFKLLHQIYAILVALTVQIPPTEFIMVQNPPSIPTLAIVWAVSTLRGSKLIIDWHNLGYSILALRLGEKHILVDWARRFERFFGQHAFAHLFVTKAMRDHLVKEWDLQGRKIVVHDRPPAHFHRTSPGVMHELFQRVFPAEIITSLDSFLPQTKPPYTTPFTSIAIAGPASPSDPMSSPINGIQPTAELTKALPMPGLRDNRPALLVSSTSWTADEDFGILLEAISQYDAKANKVNSSSSTKLPKLLVVVTGKGPLRNKYMAEVDKLQGPGGWKWVRCVSMWLKAEDYPVFLGSADLGVSLHSSSSALDLPMKIVDMFGCGLPVCALDFACLNELVVDGVNGLVFKDADVLASQLETLFSDFPKSKKLEELRSSLDKGNERAQGKLSHGDSSRGENTHLEQSWCSWSENWNRLVKPLCLVDADRFEYEM